MIKIVPNFINSHRARKKSPSPREKITEPSGVIPTEKQQIYGDIGMRIDRDGTWHYQGSPIQRKELVRLFSKALQRDREGNHGLITPTEIAPIKVDDAAFIVVGMDVKGTSLQQNIFFQTMLDNTYKLSKEYPLRIEVNPETKEPAPYLLLNQGLEAKLSRSIFFDLANLAVEGKNDGANVLGVWSGGTFHVMSEENNT